MLQPLGLNPATPSPSGQHGSLKPDALKTFPTPLTFADGRRTLAGIRKSPLVELEEQIEQDRQLAKDS